MDNKYTNMREFERKKQGNKRTASSDSSTLQQGKRLRVIKSPKMVNCVDEFCANFDEQVKDFDVMKKLFQKFNSLENAAINRGTNIYNQIHHYDDLPVNLKKEFQRLKNLRNPKDNSWGQIKNGFKNVETIDFKSSKNKTKKIKN